MKAKTVFQGDDEVTSLPDYKVATPQRQQTQQSWREEDSLQIDLAVAVLVPGTGHTKLEAQEQSILLLLLLLLVLRPHRLQLALLASCLLT